MPTTPKKPPCCGIIPARWGSSRFPGKPLTPILGKPMLVHVYERAVACPDMDAVYLATDDERIAATARDYGVPVLMTPADCLSGSDRVCRAALALGLPDNAVVVNIQGDEPALEPMMLSLLLLPFFDDPEVRVSTLAHPLFPEAVANPDRVKVVVNLAGDALYFSRSPIPYVRERSENSPSPLGHVGLYAFKFETLRRFLELSPSPLEKLEQLEQLRLLENGIPIRVALTSYKGHGVDRPEDVPAVEEILRAALLKK